MKFAQVQGNAGVVSAFVGMVDSGRIPHAILLHEDDGGGAFPLAMAFLQYLYCGNRGDSDSCGLCPGCNKIEKFIHPDIHFILPLTASASSSAFIGQFRELARTNPCFTEEELGEALGIEAKSSVIAVTQAKEIIQTLSLSALEGGYRAVVIYLPEKMNAEAANRLLKIIEEPPLKTQFVLITHAPEKVMQTIASRCQRIRVVPPKRGIRKANETYEQLLEALMEALISRNLMQVLEAADSIAALPSRENAKAFCKFAAGSMRTVFLLQQGLESLAADASESERNWASACRKTFARETLASLGRAHKYIERNVNQKIVFADMACRLFNKI